MEVVKEQAENPRRPLRNDDHIFFPEADSETREIALAWTMVDVAKRAGMEDRGYAFLKSGIMPTEKTVGRFSKAELMQWQKALREYEKWKKQGKNTIVR